MGTSIAGDIVAAIAARIALRPAESLAAALDLAASASLSRSIISAPSGCRRAAARSGRSRRSRAPERSAGCRPPSPPRPRSDSATFCAAASRRSSDAGPPTSGASHETSRRRLSAAQTSWKSGHQQQQRPCPGSWCWLQAGCLPAFRPWFWYTHHLNDLHLAEIETLCLSLIHI